MCMCMYWLQPNTQYTVLAREIRIRKSVADDAKSEKGEQANATRCNTVLSTKEGVWQRQSWFNWAADGRRQRWKHSIHQSRMPKET